jgi:ribonuclease BN (tRNA processing enzyme)
MHLNRAAVSTCQLLLVLAMTLTAVAKTESHHQPTAATRTKLVMLGTGNPNPNPDRFGPATVVVVDEVPYLVDAGVGVVRRWTAAIRKHKLQSSVWDLRTLLVTHLHSDHTLGYADVIFTPWTIRDPRPGSKGRQALDAFGPPGLRAMTDHLLAAYAEDIEIRSDTRGTRPDRPGPVVTVREIDVGVVLKDERVTITAFRVPHGRWKHAFGFKFVTPDKTIVISGDTAFSPEIAKQCGGCDILVHEGGISDDPSEYFRTYHTTADELGRLARDGKPKLLVLYHQRGPNEDGVRAIRAQFDGRVVVASDLDLFE